MPAASDGHVRRVRQLLQELKSTALFSEDLVRAWSTRAGELAGIDPALIIEVMAQDDFWRWQWVIADLLKDLTNHRRFAEVAHAVVGKAGSDLASGPLLLGLVEAGAADPQTSKGLVHELLDRGDTKAGAIAGRLVAGVARGDPGWSQAWILRTLGESDPAHQVAALSATVQIRADKIVLRDDLIGRLLQLPPPSDEDAQHLYALCLRSLHPHDRESVERQVLALSSEVVPWVRAWILESLATLPGFSLSSRKRLVEGAKGIADPQLQEQLAWLLGAIYREDRHYVLGFIGDIMQKDLLSNHLGMNGEGLLSREIGRVDRDGAFEALDTWMGKPTYVLFLQAHRFLVEVYEGDPLPLVAKLRLWNTPSTPRLGLRLQVLQDLISARLGARADPVRDVCVKEVLDLATEHGWRVESILKAEPDPTFQALKIIHLILSPRRELDDAQLLANLDLIPHVRDFMTREWFEKEARKKGKGHPLLYLFDHRQPSEAEVEQAREALEREEDLHLGMTLESRYRHRLWERRIFACWDDIFAHLDLKKPGIGQLRRDLRTSERPGDFLCEAEVISLLGRGFTVRPKRKVPGIRGALDLQVDLTDQSPYLEIYNYQMPREVQYSSVAVGVPMDHLKSRVVDKFERQLKEGAESITDPVIIVINTTDAMADMGWEIDDMFSGTKALGLAFDKVTGKGFVTGPTRRQDALGQKEPGTSVISGAITYQRDLTDPRGPMLKVQYYPNPFARVPLSDKSVHEVCTALSPRMEPHPQQQSHPGDTG